MPFRMNLCVFAFPAFANSFFKVGVPVPLVWTGQEQLEILRYRFGNSRCVNLLVVYLRGEEGESGLFPTFDPIL